MQIRELVNVTFCNWNSANGLTRSEPGEWSGHYLDLVSQLEYLIRRTDLFYITIVIPTIEIS